MGQNKKRDFVQIIAHASCGGKVDGGGGLLVRLRSAFSRWVSRSQRRPVFGLKLYFLFNVKVSGRLSLGLLAFYKNEFHCHSYIQTSVLRIRPINVIIMVEHMTTFIFITYE
jgi:hypothetical protein